MYIVRGLDVSSRIIDVHTRKVYVQSTLFSRVVQEVVEQILEVSNWRLILFDGNSFSEVSTGDVVRLMSPLIVGRRCLGENIVSTVNSVEEGIIYVYRRVIPCVKKPVDGFCIVHRDSEYGKYLSYVYGLKEFPPDVGLAKIPHMVYLLYVGGSSAKVGIANAIKNLNRLFEQVFLYASVIAFLDDVVKAREVEKFLAAGGLKDRAMISERIDWIKRVRGEDLDRVLKSYVNIFIKYVKPLLRSLSIGVESRALPVLRFSDRFFTIANSTIVIGSRKALDVLEGRAEVEEYCLGGIVVNLDGRRFLIPYQMIRDSALNIEIIK